MHHNLTKTNREYLCLMSIIVISAVLISLCIHDGHNWSGDYALYIEQAQAILNGSIDKLYALNKYTNEHAFRVQSPDLYPMGFPILLLTPYYFMGMNFLALKIFSCLFFLGSLPVFYTVFRRYFFHPFYPICVIIAFAFHYEFISFSDNVYSEFSFLFFSALAFLQMRKENTCTNQLLMGGLIFFSYYIRDIGIVLVPTLLVYQIQMNVISKAEKKERWYYLIPYLVFATLYVLNAIFLPKGSGNLYAYISSKLSWELVLTHSIGYMDLLSTYFFINRLILFFVLMLFFTGVWATRKEQLYFVVYIFLSLAIYICWPAWQGLRFIFPILPFIIYFIIKGFEQFVLALKITPRYPAALLICGLCYMSYQSLQRIIDFSKVDTNLAYNAETKLMYAYISNNIPEGEIIGFAKPRPLRLFTGRNSILSDLEHFDGSGLTYLLIRAEDVPSGAKIPYKKVYETKRLILVLR